MLRERMILSWIIEPMRDSEIMLRPGFHTKKVFFSALASVPAIIEIYFFGISCNISKISYTV